MNILIVGAGGRIASGLDDLIKKYCPNWKTTPFSSKDDRGSFGKVLKKIDAVALAISKKDDGTAEASYAFETLDAGKPLVIAGKAALSEYPDRFEPYLDMVGYSATVGAGSLLYLLAKPFGVKRMLAIHNGTLNYIACLRDKGTSEEEAIRIVQDLNLCESGPCSFEEIVNAENEDACRKAVIEHNLAYHGESMIRYSECSRMLFSKEGATGLFGKGRRFVVRISSRKEPEEERGSTPCFWIRTSSHSVRGDFIDPKGLFPFLPNNAENCLLVEDYGGRSFASGPGAGITPTADAMLKDLKTLLHTCG